MERPVKLQAKDVRKTYGSVVALEGTSIDLLEGEFLTLLGPSGSGKTTFLEQFVKNEVAEVVTEPVEEWRNLCGHNILQLMYEDPSRWSHLFQSYVQLTMTKHHVQPLSSNQVNF